MQSPVPGYPKLFLEATDPGTPATPILPGPLPPGHIPHCPQKARATTLAWPVTQMPTCPAGLSPQGHPKQPHPLRTAAHVAQAPPQPHPHPEVLSQVPHPSHTHPSQPLHPDTRLPPEPKAWEVSVEQLSNWLGLLDPPQLPTLTHHSAGLPSRPRAPGPLSILTGLWVGEGPAFSLFL